MNKNAMSIGDDSEQVEIELGHLFVRAEQMRASLGAASDQENQARFDATWKGHTVERASDVPNG